MAMSNCRSEVRLTTDIEAAEEPAAEELSDERPFVIVVLGDFRCTPDDLPVMPLRSLTETRRSLEDPAQFDAVAAEVMRWAQPTSADTPRTPAVAPFNLLARAGVFT